MQLAFSCRTTFIASRSARRNTAARRRAFFETLEARTVMAPFGAFPDDTGEYMLGDVLVTVVLMESDPTLPGADFNTEDWTPATIGAVQQKVQDGMNWWKETLRTTPDIYYNEQLPLLDFKYDWTWALDPVETMYEPINRYSSMHELWIQEFLDRPDVNFAHSLDIYKDVKAFNNFQRERHNTDWAFTIFVVNSTNDGDDFFPLNPSPSPGEANYRGAFAFLGGQFLVVPSDRPTTTFAHETGHIFYALDEYSNGHSYHAKSGYYNTQNTNSARDNPTENFVSIQQPSMMATGAAQTLAWNNFVTSTSSAAAIGWQDTDGDGVLDVLDVPFSLKGVGTFNPAAGTYQFSGTSHVQTLANKNTFGGQNTNVVYNDITINKIRRAEYKLDDGAWTTIAEYQSPTYHQDLNFTIPGITTGAHTLRIRTFDTRTGAMSEEFVAAINPSGTPTPPQLAAGAVSSVNGFLFSDANANGQWDHGESPLVGWNLELRNIEDGPLTLAQTIEPSDYGENTHLNNIEPGITVSAVGATVSSNLVLSRNSIRGAGQVFFAGTHETFATIRVPGSYGTILDVDRRLRFDFASPVTSVSLKAISGAVGSGSSVARLLAYDANNNLIDRYTTRALAPGQSEVMTIAHAKADIKYVVAVGHLETEVLFDSLVVGPATATTTKSNGSFSLDSLPPGTYNLQVLSAPNYTGISPLDGRISFTVPAEGGSSGNQYLAFQYDGNPWRNQVEPLDVNGVGGITAFDALMVINFINLNPHLPVLIAGEATPGHYLDVNDDNRCTAFDALAIINYLNTNLAGTGGEDPVREPREATDQVIGNGNGGGAGGEGYAAQSADDYFAAGPIHISQRFKDAGHDHAHDELDQDEHWHDDEHDDHDSVTNHVAPRQAVDALFGFAGNFPDSHLASSFHAEEESPFTSILPERNVVTSWVAPLLDRLKSRRSTDEEDTSTRRQRLTSLRSQATSLLDLLAQNLERAGDAAHRLPPKHG